MTDDVILTFEFPSVFKFIAVPRKLNITEYRICQSDATDLG